MPLLRGRTASQVSQLLSGRAINPTFSACSGVRPVRGPRASEMSFHRCLSDAEPLPDFGVCQPNRNVADDLAFARGELLTGRRGSPLRGEFRLQCRRYPDQMVVDGSNCLHEGFDRELFLDDCTRTLAKRSKGIFEPFAPGENHDLGFLRERADVAYHRTVQL